MIQARPAKKTGHPKWPISFYIVLKKWVFQAHRRVPPTTGVVELWKKNILQWKPMELGGDPQKIDEYFHLGRIFYVCSSARNWVSFMYKSIYHLCNSLWEVATLDVWSSSTTTFQQKNRSPEMTNFFLYCIKKWVFQAHRRVPPMTGVVELWKKTILQWKPMEFGGDPQKNDSYVHWGPIFYVCSSARNWVSSMYKGIYQSYP